MHLVLEPRAMPHDLVAPRHQSALAFGRRVRRPDLRQVAGRLQTGERAGIDLVGLYVSLGDRLHLQRIGDNHPRHERRQHSRDRHAVGGRFDHHLITGQQGLAKSLQRSPRHIDAARMSEPAVFPKHHLPEGSVDIDANHPSHSHLLPDQMTGAAGRHDNYGFALSAQPGESQRRPANNSSSRLIVLDRPARTFVLPVPLSRWSHHTPRSKNRSANIGTAHLIPVKNPIESTFATVRHRTSIKGCLSQRTALAMVFKLLEGAQKSWRRLDGHNQLPKLVLGVTFNNGIEVIAKPADLQPITAAA